MGARLRGTGGGEWLAGGDTCEDETVPVRLGIGEW